MSLLKVSSFLPIRLDRYLKKKYYCLTQGIIEKKIRIKEILVNFRRSTANYRLQTGDLITINNDSNFIKYNNKLMKFSDSVISLANKLLGEYLIYQNDHILVINKPSSIATQGGTKINLSIDSALLYLNSLGGDFKLVHRLDKDTSGILLIAKNHLSSIKLIQAFQDRLINKTYFALTVGNLDKDSGEIINFIAKKNGVVYIDNTKNGKLAITHYKLVKVYGITKNTNLNISLVEFRPITGRTHQIRLHAKMLNIRIIGDIKYGDLESISIYHKMLLHANTIVLPKIIFGECISVSIDLPKYFFNVIKKI